MKRRPNKNEDVHQCRCQRGKFTSNFLVKCKIYNLFSHSSTKEEKLQESPDQNSCGTLSDTSSSSSSTAGASPTSTNLNTSPCDLKLIWEKLGEQDIERGVATNLIPNGVVKNNKRMRFETRTIGLGHDIED